jgi:hypothetical protein
MDEKNRGSTTYRRAMAGRLTIVATAAEGDCIVSIPNNRETSGLFLTFHSSVFAPGRNRLACSHGVAVVRK